MIILRITVRPLKIHLFSLILRQLHIIFIIIFIILLSSTFHEEVASLLAYFIVILLTFIRLFVKCIVLAMAMVVTRPIHFDLYLKITKKWFKNE